MRQIRQFWTRFEFVNVGVVPCVQVLRLLHEAEGRPSAYRFIGVVGAFTSLIKD